VRTSGRGYCYTFKASVTLASNLDRLARLISYLGKSSVRKERPELPTLSLPETVGLVTGIGEFEGHTASYEVSKPPGTCQA
jgi:hypothetical protein